MIRSVMEVEVTDSPGVSEGAGECALRRGAFWWDSYMLVTINYSWKRILFLMRNPIPMFVGGWYFPSGVGLRQKPGHSKFSIHSRRVICCGTWSNQGPAEFTPRFITWKLRGRVSLPFWEWGGAVLWLLCALSEHLCLYLSSIGKGSYSLWLHLYKK